MRIKLIGFYVKKENQTSGLEERKIWVNFSYLATSLAKKAWPCKWRRTCWIPPNKWMTRWPNKLMNVIQASSGVVLLVWEQLHPTITQKCWIHNKANQQSQPLNIHAQMMLPDLLPSAEQGVHCTALWGASHHTVIKNMFNYCNHFPAKVIPGSEP